MSEHKYVVGDRVRLLPDKLNSHVRPGVYTVVRALPSTGGGLQYRAKHALDSHERVLDEAQIRAA